VTIEIYQLSNEYLKAARENLSKWDNSQLGMTLKFAAEYTAPQEENNKHVFEILEKHYSLMEPDDSGVFAEFVLDRARFAIDAKLSHDRKYKDHLEEYEHVVQEHFMSGKFIQAVAKRFSDKQTELAELLK
jgi:hypothetical protein